MLSAISDMAAASSRRSISISTECAKRVDDGERPQPARGRMEAFDLPGGEAVAVKVAAKALFNAWAQDLDGDVATALAIEHHRLVHLGDRGCRDGRAELGKMIL